MIVNEGDDMDDKRIIKIADGIQKCTDEKCFRANQMIDWADGEMGDTLKDVVKIMVFGDGTKSSYNYPEFSWSITMSLDGDFLNFEISGEGYMLSFEKVIGFEIGGWDLKFKHIGKNGEHEVGMAILKKGERT